MSFILDALKKSETDRQQQGSAEFAGVPTSSGRREGPPAWLWIVGALLVVNIGVLLGIFFRPGVTPPDAEVSRPAPEPGPSQVAEQDFADQVAVARQNAPPPQPAARTTADRSSESVTRPPVTASESANTAALPTIHEVLANGLLKLPALHVDIHVYSEIPEDRFVFINMVKHNEGSRLAEGPLVKEIAPDGVVLTMSGTTFLLPRD